MTKTQALMESARRIASREVDVESWVGPRNILPVLNNPSVIAAGCGSCGSH